METTTKISNKETKAVMKAKPTNKSLFTTKQVKDNVRDIFTPNNAVNNAVEFFNVNNGKFNLGEDKHWTKVQPSALPDDISLAMKNNFMVHWFNNQSPLLMGWKKVDVDGKKEKIIKGIKEGGSSFNVTPSMLLTLPKKSEFTNAYGNLAWDYIYLMSNNFKKAYSKSVKSLQEKGIALIKHQDYLDAVEKSGGDIEAVEMDEPKTSTGRDRSVFQMIQWETIGKADEHSKKDANGNNQDNEKSLSMKIINSKDKKAIEGWKKVVKALEDFQKIDRTTFQ
tara:strand:- start:95 stop:934 length:840 start_codon:yes stop_codon:yes gene_type:complete